MCHEIRLVWPNELWRASGSPAARVRRVCAPVAFVCAFERNVWLCVCVCLLLSLSNTEDWSELRWGGDKTEAQTEKERRPGRGQISLKRDTEQKQPSRAGIERWRGKTDRKRVRVRLQSRLRRLWRILCLQLFDIRLFHSLEELSC